ncbi:hypothetical protein J3F84DRAFT_360643 [Trichoderma pleuroticola]
MVTSSLIACLVVLAGVAVAYPGRFPTFAAHHFANTNFKSQLPQWLKATQFFDDVDLLRYALTQSCQVRLLLPYG